jgi:hypothetical protein
MSIETLAEMLYEHYCIEVGGIAFNGDPLPSWMNFALDEKKSKQVAAWRSLAAYTINLFTQKIETRS